MNGLYKRTAEKCAKYAQKTAPERFSESLTAECQNHRHFGLSDFKHCLLVNHR
jgi:hypothetical protein